MSRVPVDVIFSAERPELLEMFRRMNSYTAPLNTAERRHSIFQGRFKWFVVELADVIGPILEEFGILTTKQMVRMADAELIAELVLIIEKGLISKSDKTINDLYKTYNDEFPLEDEYSFLITHFFELIRDRFGELRNSMLMKTYALHSTFSVYTQIKRGIPNGYEHIGVETSGVDFQTDEQTVQRLLNLADSHETKDTEGPYREYVQAAIGTTTKAAQRRARSRVLATILKPA